jgi:hypothetical protein
MPDCTSLYSTIVAFVNATSAGKDVYLSLTISIHYIDGTVAYLYNGANPFTAASTSLTMSSTVVSLSGAVAGTQVKGSGPWNVATLPDGTVNVQEDLGRIVLPQLHFSFKADCNLDRARYERPPDSSRRVFQLGTRHYPVPRAHTVQVKCTGGSLRSIFQSRNRDQQPPLGTIR